jgi:hypothetical protein
MSQQMVRVQRGMGSDEYDMVPRDRVPAGYTRVYVQDRGEVFLDPTWVGVEAELRHSPFTAEALGRLRVLQAVFADVYPRSLEEWEEDFRRDQTPWREVALWEMIAVAFRRYTQHLSGSGELAVQKRRDVFALIMGLVNDGIPSVAAGAKFGAVGTLTANRVREIVAYMAGDEVRSAFHAALKECRTVFRRQILEADYPNKVNFHTLFDSEMKMSHEAPFDVREYLATADLIISEDVDSAHRRVIHGEDLHARLVAGAVDGLIDATGLRLVTVMIDEGTGELERLVAAVRTVKR